MGLDRTGNRQLRNRAATRVFARVRRALAATLRRFGADARGGLVPFFALSVIPLMAVVGIGTDTARGYILKSRLSYALDSAGLAGARVVYSPTRDADIQMYFAVNFPPGYMDATLDGPHFTVSADSEVVTLDASATVGTTFMRLLGIATMTVHASTEVTRETQMLDVVLSVDVSGSMSQSVGGQTKISAARDAANTLIDILFGSNATNSLLHIGLVPWNSKVNVWTAGGPAYSSAATTTQGVASFNNPVTGAAQSVVYFANNSEVPLLNAPASTWKGCVYARYVHDGVDTNDADLLEGLLSVGGKDWVAWQPIGVEGEPVSGPSRCTSAVGSSECTPCPNYGITPLTDTKATIQASIDALLTPNGNTNLPQGLDMAWQVLTPTAPYSQAVANPPGKRKQAIVLLTDGENYGGSGDAYKGVFGIGSTAQAALDARLRTLAANIKATGVIIYAIQFGDITPAQELLMQDVASGPDAPYYFYAPDAATLNSAFQQIANNLSELRLSK